MSNTAMQELKQWFLDTPPSTRYACMAEKINMLLKVEKQNIIDAYYAGTAQFDNAAPIVYPLKPEDYYNQTYQKINP